MRRIARSGLPVIFSSIQIQCDKNHTLPLEIRVLNLESKNVSRMAGLRSMLDACAVEGKLHSVEHLFLLSGSLFQSRLFNLLVEV